MLTVATQGIMYFLTILMYFGILIIFAVFLHIMYLHFPVTLGTMTFYWNQTVASYWREYVIGSLEYTEDLFEKFIGVYNLAVYLFLKLPISLLLYMARASGNFVTTG
jgi:hypothetical protein